MSYKRLPLIQLSGSNYEMGYQHGQQCKDKIKTLSKSLLVLAQKRLPGLTYEKALSLAKKFEPFIEEYAPHLIDEMKGIAEGTGLPLEEIYYLNARTEFSFRPTGCTTFALAKSRTADGAVMLGHNVDTAANMESQLVMLHMTPKKGPCILMFVRAGTIGAIGINSDGLARVGNGLKSQGYRELGVPVAVIHRMILEQKTVKTP